MSLDFVYPQVFFALPVVILLLFFFVSRTYINFQNRQEKKEYIASKKKSRFLMLGSRIVLVSLLIYALAGPFTTDTKTVQGTPKLSILVDESVSMEMFDQTLGETLRSRIGGRVPLTLRSIASDNRSAIGDGIINYAQGDDSVLLISDGHSQYGRSLADVMLFATRLNTTVSAVQLSPLYGDALVEVQGPRRTTMGVETEFFAVVRTAGNLKSFSLTVDVDGEEILREQIDGTQTFRFSVSLSEGYHRIEARIGPDDFFMENNVFHKVVKVEPKPKVLFVGSGSSPMRRLFEDLYELSAVSNLPNEFGEHAAVVLSDQSLSQLTTSKLIDYVSDGNGLVVVGGKNAYDRGAYKDSIFETLLPVVVGSGEKQPSRDVNIVVLIDISGSGSEIIRPGSTLTKAEVSKSLALSLLDDLKPEDNVAVMAFHTRQILVSPLSQLSQKRDQVENQISRMFAQAGPGTLIGEGLASARQLLAPLEGSKNIILLSDGIPGGPPGDDTAAARTAAIQGTKIFAIQVGDDPSGQTHLQNIAEAGNGVYFKTDENKRLRVLFGEAEPTETDNFRLQIINGYHFITNNLALDGEVTGFNFVVPKQSADMLVATADNNPLLTVWRFGLGRVASLSTDDGSAWAGSLVGRDNSRIISKTVNWAVGDLSRDKRFDVQMRDSYQGDTIEVNVISDSLPIDDEIKFSKVGERQFAGRWVPDDPGFHKLFNAVVAVNYPKELSDTGPDPKLTGLVQLSNGKMFDPTDVDGIIDKVLADSRREETARVSHAWLLIFAALIWLLLEIAVRKLSERRNFK